MNAEALRLARNILLRTFVAGVVIAAVLGFVTIEAWNFWIKPASRWFHTDAAAITPIVLNFFMNVRFFLLFVILAPALALHWTLKDKGRSGK